MECKRNRVLGGVLLATTLWALAGCSGATDSGASTGETPSPTANLTVEITSPPDGAGFDQDAPITFEGGAMPGSSIPLPEENLTWTSDRDGTIGVGSVFRRSGLSPGTHTITLTATASDGQQKQARRQITIRPAPTGVTVVITFPPAGTRIKSYDLIRLEGVATDPSGAVIGNPLALEWRSNLDNVLGNGASIEPGGLSPGLHRIRLRAEMVDPGSGNIITGEGEIELQVDFANEPAMNAEILAPMNGSLLNANQSVTCIGTAEDENGNRLSGQQMIWTSSLDGLFGIGETCIVDHWTPGTHRITMTATSPSGKKTTTSIILHFVQ